MDELIERGLRAQLGLDSFVTGQLFVGLEFYPDTEANIRGDTPDPEIPTIPSIWAKFENTATQALAGAPDTIAGIDEIVRSVSQFMDEDTAGNLKATINNMAEFTGRLVDPEAPVAQSMDALPQAVANLDSLIVDVREFYPSCLGTVRGARSQDRQCLGEP